MTNKEHDMNIPEGWQLVPEEPTQEMYRAGVAVKNWAVLEIYDAMLNAAPAPPAQQDDEALELLRLALDALTCDHTGDDIADSHRCGKCDENVDRNANVRQRIRAILTKRGSA